MNNFSRSSFICLMQAAILFIAIVGSSAVSVAQSAGYDRGFFIESEEEDFRLRMNMRTQTRYTLEMPEDENEEMISSITMRRVRLKFSGHAYSEDLRYYLQLDFGRGSSAVIDAYTNYTFRSGFDLRIGSFKTPFSRQQLTSSGSLALVDRSPSDKAFGAGRDIGLMFHNGSLNQFEWAVGVFTGGGISSRVNGGNIHGTVVTDSETSEVEGSIEGARISNVEEFELPMIVGRIGFNFGEIRGYKESDFSGGALRFATGISLLSHVDEDMIAEFDTSVKGFGTSLLATIFYRQNSEIETSDMGFFIQADYLYRERFGPVVRFTQISEDEEVASRELIGGFNVYFNSHKVKWQNDFALLSSFDGDEESTEQRFRSQLQFAF